ncbi:MAG: 3-oxoacyl-[acyl-carrier protein] reductase [Gammaproteobacteria bacterium]|jgi:3-oxoacyl-[acyl-carrier protein] reductase
MNISLDGKIALVTGASRGIGRTIATTLAEAGATVVGTATSQAGADLISEAMSAIQADSRGIVLNVTDPEGVVAAIKALSAEVGAPTIVVNNAGITKDGLMMRMSEDDWAATMDANLSGTFRITKACLRGMMKAKQGRVINIGSVVASMGNPGQTNYCASKAGLFGFSKSLALEVASRGITVNCVTPGFIASDMTDALDAEQRAGLAARVPLGRVGEPSDIAAAVLFLASDMGAYITGETINVNGGMYMS